MNAFRENPLFLFVDDLADDSSNFATDGKIVELFDTGCDARMPGGAFEASKSQEPGPTIQGRGSPRIPNIRKPFSLSLRQNKTEVNKNERPPSTEVKRQNITRTSKSPMYGKPMTWNPKLRDTVPIRNDGTEAKAGLDPVVEYSTDVESPGPKGAKLNVISSRIFSKYGGRKETDKLQSIKSSIPKRSKAAGGGSSICCTLEGQAKTSTTKSVTNSRMTSSTKTSKVTSVELLNHGVKKFVNRAVDKDSLSNCSRQLESAKTSKSPSFSKTGYSSKLPRSIGAPKFLCKRNTPSDFSPPIGTVKEATIEPETEYLGEGLQSEGMKTSATVSPGKCRDRLGGETTSKGTLNASPDSISQKKHGTGVKAKFVKSGNSDHRDPRISSSSKSKMSVSKVPQPRFGRNVFIADRSVPRREHSDKDGQKFESNEILLSKMDMADKAECRDFDNKLSDNERPVTYSEKVPARPSAKCYNLTSHKNDTIDKTISFEKKLSKPRNPSFVPKLMNEFRLQVKKENEVSECSPRSMAVRSPEVKIEGGETKADFNGKPATTSGLLSNNRNEGRSRFSDRVQKVLGSKTPLLKEVTECLGTNLRSVDRTEQNKSKVDKESTCLSGVQAVHENDEEVELRTIYEDAPETTSHKPTVESPASLSRTSNTKESKFRHSPFHPFATESKVPRPVVTNRIPKKETVKDFPDRKLSKKQESSTLPGPPKNSFKSGTKSEAKPSTPLTKKFRERLSESENVSEKDEDEDVIPIMNPALYNIRSFAPYHGEGRNLEYATPQKTVRGRKFESWMDGHEQAYLKGRAIGLRVASMARAAKEDSKREYFKGGFTSTKPMSMPDKSREIVDIGVSVLEKVLAEKENKIHSPSLRGDQIFNYHDFEKKTKLNTGQWFV